MVFSTLFGQKKDKEVPTKAPRPNPSGPSAPAPAPSPAISADTRTGVPTIRRPRHRSISQWPAPDCTCQCARTGTGHRRENRQDRVGNEPRFHAAPDACRQGGAAPARSATPAPEPQKKRSKRPDGGGTTTLPSLGQTTDILLGDSILANAMEISDSASSPAIEEAAILYANGPAAARRGGVVRCGTCRQLGIANTQACLMLFELYQVLGKRAEFENLAIDYAIRFETSSPNWSELKECQARLPHRRHHPVRQAGRGGFQGGSVERHRSAARPAQEAGPEESGAAPQLRPCLQCRGERRRSDLARLRCFSEVEPRSGDRRRRESGRKTDGRTSKSAARCLQCSLDAAARDVPHLGSPGRLRGNQYRLLRHLRSVSTVMGAAVDQIPPGRCAAGCS